VWWECFLVQQGFSDYYRLYDLSEQIVGVGRHDVMGDGTEPNIEGFEPPTHVGVFPNATSLGQSVN
jgi:hypothetical protein